MKSTEVKQPAPTLELTIRPVKPTERCADAGQDPERDLRAKVVVVTGC